MTFRRNPYRAHYLQQGRGFGSVISGLFRLLTPFIKRGAAAALKSKPVKRAIRSAKRSAVKTAASAASDLLSGKNPAQRAKLNLKQAQSDIEKALTSAGGENKAARSAAKRKIPVVGAVTKNKIRKKPTILPLI